MVYDGTANSVTFNASGKFGQSINAGYYSVAGVISNPPITIEGWGKGGSVTGTRVMMGRVNSFWVGSINNIVTAKYGSLPNEVTLSSSTNMSDGNWHHYALVLDTTGGTLYFDGNPVASSTVSPAAAGYVAASSNTFGIGNFGAGGAMWGTGREVDEVRVSTGVRYNGSFQPPSAAFTPDSSTVGLYHLDGDGLNAQSSPPTVTTIAPNNSAISYSPYNWLVTAGNAKSINSGAYFSTLFSGLSCTLNFDLTGIATPFPQIKYRVDRGPWVDAETASTITVTIPTYDQNWQRHYLEVVVKSTTETQNRWTTQSTAVKFTGLTLSLGETVSALTGYDNSPNIIFYGDSITEGVRTENSDATGDTNRNDATKGWAWEVGRMLGANFGLVGFGGSGIFITSGSGSVPALTTTYNQLWSGQARSFTPQPDLIVLNEGTNEGGVSDANFQAAAINILNSLLTACPTAKIAIMQTFNDIQSANWQIAIPQCSDPSRVSWVPTPSFFPTPRANYSSDGLHPYGWINLSNIAPRLYPTFKALLDKPSGFKSRLF
jgi:lysophospholipase L1-like esterase